MSPPRPLSELLERATPLQLPVPPDFTALNRTVKRVLDRWDRPEKPERDPERLLAEMADRIARRDWHKVPMSFATRAARLAFSAPWRDDPAHDRIRAFLLAEIAASTRAGFLNPMLRIYIETFAPGAVHSADLARHLKGAQSRLGAQWRQLLDHVPELLDPQHAPEAIATRMAQMEDPWTGLRRIGLRHPHAPGLMDAAHLAFVRQIAPRLDQRPEIERLLDWLRPAGQTARVNGAAEAIEALLRPWAEQAPPPDTMTLLTDRLTELYGHPRVSRNAIWNLIDPSLEKQLLRWLMGSDIRFLFRVLTEVERGHMWRDREDFWWTKYEQGLLDEVWIAFNSEGYRAATSKLPPDTRHSAYRFAHQTGEKDKSLLFMRIGNKIVVEGTYNFKVHIFPADAELSPKLYQRQYDVDHIRARGRHGAKTIPHLGDWQSRVSMSL